MGCAVGVFIGFTPLFGFQFALAGLLAWVLGGSVIAAVLGTFVANPLSFPLIWYSTYKLGCVMMTGNVFGACGAFPQGVGNWAVALFERLMDFSIETSLLLFQGVWPVIKPMAIGSLPIGALAAAASYFLVRHLVSLRQSRRRERFGALRSAIVPHMLAVPINRQAEGT